MARDGARARPRFTRLWRAGKPSPRFTRLRRAGKPRGSARPQSGRKHEAFAQALGKNRQKRKGGRPFEGRFPQVQLSALAACPGSFTRRRWHRIPRGTERWTANRAQPPCS
jgi:hypothetical protein